MTLTQLRTFLAVAETGSIRAAAEQLVVTQSAVSASLAALQKSLGVRLIRREGRGLVLTDAGVTYAGYVRGLLGLMEEARTAAAAVADPQRGDLRIAAVTTAGEQILPGLLAGFRRRHPQAGVLLEVGNRDRVRGLLDQHEVDLVLCGRPSTERGVAVHAVRPHELVVVTSPELAAEAAQERVESWLARQTWLLREPGSGTRAATDELLDELEARPRTLTVGSNVAIRESIIAGLGVTLLSRDAIQRELAERRLVVLPTPVTPLPRDWYVIARPGRLLATAALFVAHVVEDGEFHPPRRKPRRASTRST